MRVSNFVVRKLVDGRASCGVASVPANKPNLGVWESGLIQRTANAPALNWARWFKSNRARQPLI